MKRRNTLKILPLTVLIPAFTAFSLPDRTTIAIQNKVVASNSQQALPQPVILFQVPDKYVPLPLEDQKMAAYLEEHIQQTLQERLLKIDEKKLMADYLHRPGEQEWIGEHAGKYLETACNTWKYTHNAALKVQMDRIARTLIGAQFADGYLGTYTPDMYWKSWDVWSHKYNRYRAGSLFYGGHDQRDTGHFEL